MHFFAEVPHRKNKHLQKFWDFLRVEMADSPYIDFQQQSNKVLKKKEKLDGVGPVDNRPSPDKLHHFVKKKRRKKEKK